MASRRLQPGLLFRGLLLRGVAATALCAVACSPAAIAATHPVAHPVSHTVAVKGKAKPEPVAAHASNNASSKKSSTKDKAKAVPVKAVAKSVTAKGRRVAVEDDAPVVKGHAKASAGAKAGAKGAKLKPKSTDAPERPAGKAGTKSRHRKQLPADDSDNDPPIIHRASAKRGAHETVKVPERTVASATHEPAPAVHEVARETEVSDAPAVGGSAFPDGVITGHHERRPGPAATAVKHGAASAMPADTSTTDPASNNQATSDDFLRAAGVARTEATLPATKTVRSGVFASGESHPDDDVRVDMRVPASVRHAVPSTPAIVTATPAPMVVAKNDAPKKKTKVSVLPDDLAGKDAVIQDAMTPMVLPNLYSNGRLVVPPPMKGSHDILVHQNLMADNDGLTRIQDDDDLDRMRAAHLLVPVFSSDALEVNSELPINRRYARPWTVRFVQDTARAYYARFHEPLRLSSAVRTVSYQLRLQRVNGNAAAVDGDGASPHLTGQAIDFGKHGMSVAEIAWMRAYLGPIMDSGKIDVEEEFQQACFHISVYKAYVPAPKKPRVMDVAQVRQAPIVRRAPRPQLADQAADGPSDSATDASPDNESRP